MENLRIADFIRTEKPEHVILIESSTAHSEVLELPPLTGELLCEAYLVSQVVHSQLVTKSIQS